MIFSINNVCTPRPIGGGYLQPINVKAERLAFTLTARYMAISPANVLKSAPYPMTAVLIEYEL